jgi:DNA polymerase-1
MADKKHLVIVDGMGFIFRAYHAVRGNLSRSRDGLPTNALFGFAQMLVKVVDDLKPDSCVVALDSKGPNWRHALYPDYKANRPAPDEALVRQLEYIEPMIAAFGLPMMRIGGVEADDIIATLVKQCGDCKITIVTSDKDLLQLVGDEVELLDTLKDKHSGPQQAVEKFGVLPDLIVDVQGLMGDSVDNIPGVPGVGPKTAAELVQQFGDLDSLYARVGEVARETLREKLVANKDNALLSRELARLKYDVALPELDLTFHPHLHQAAEYLRDELEFKTLAARLDKRKERLKGGDGEVGGAGSAAFGAIGGRAALPADDGHKGAASQDYSIPSAKDAEGWGGYECVKTKERWDWWMAEARKRGAIAFDTETTSLDPYDAVLVGVSLALGAGEACYVPVKAPATLVSAEKKQGGLFDADEARPLGPHGVEGLDVLADLKALLADPAVKKIGHNLKYDWEIVARALEITPAETCDGLQKMIVNFEDTMLMSGCLDSGRWNHGMDELVRRHLGHVMIPFSTVCGKGKAMITFDLAPLEAAVAYAAEDADATWRLYEVFKARLEGEEGSGEQELATSAMPGLAALPSPGGQKEAVGQNNSKPAALGVRFVYENVERPLLPVVVAMEARGVRLDAKALKALSADFAERMAVLEKAIWAETGHEFNVQSTQQLAVVLFDELKVGSEKLKKSRSTAVGVLEELEEAGVPLAKLIGQYRQLAKLRSTYAEALLEQVSAVTGRVHTHYQQMGAGTGRFSSNDPNLQNIPIRTEEGRKIRKTFVPREGWVMVSADYSQIELRLLAHFSGSEALQKAFNEGVDIHAYTASLIRGIPLSEVTKEQRRASKAVNFGLVYGMGARSLAGQMGASVGEAQEWIDAYFKRYEGVREYMDLNKRLARERGYVETLCGRRVWLPEINSSHGGLRAGSERAAINAPLQGSNADVIKLAMPEVEKALGTRNEERGAPAAQLLMQVHDELVLECAPEMAEELKRILPGVMGGVVSLSVPLAVEVGVGPNWEEAH